VHEKVVSMRFAASTFDGTRLLGLDVGNDGSAANVYGERLDCAVQFLDDLKLERKK
jgi:hypothetical protein